jgi:hypothetical protein
MGVLIREVTAASVMGPALSAAPVQRALPIACNLSKGGAGDDTRVFSRTAPGYIGCTSRTRRMKRKGLVFAIGVVTLAVGLMVFWVARRRPPEGFVVGMHAIDADRAVVLLRANYEKGPSRGWVTLVDARRGPVWWTELPGLAPLYGGRAVTVEGHLVTARYHDENVDESCPGTVGLALDTGAMLWRTALAPCSDGPSRVPTYGPATVRAGDRLYELFQSKDRIVIVALEAETGREVWRTGPLEGDHTRFLRTTDHWLLLEGLTELIFVNRDDGTHRRVREGFASCFVGDEILTIGEGGWLRAIHVDTLAERDVAKVMDHMAGFSCGAYRDLVVVPKDASEHASIMGAFVKSGEVAWNIPIPGARAVLLEERAASGTSALAGAPPRFVPVVSHDLDGPREGRLLMLDLDEHRIAWEGTRSENLTGIAFVQSGGQIYASLPFMRILARFDGATGKLAEAVHIEEWDGPIEPHDVAGGIWIHDHEWSNQVAVLDLLSLHAASPGGKGPRVVDARAEAARLLGVP